MAAQQLSAEVRDAIEELCYGIGLAERSDSTRLEFASAYLVLQHAGLHPEDAHAVLSKIVVGSGGDKNAVGYDGGIDAVAVAIGATCVTPDCSDEMLDEILAESGAQGVRLILLQASGADPNNTRHATLDSKLSTFTSGVEGFFLGTLEEASELTPGLQSWMRFRDRLFAAMERVGLDRSVLSVSALLVIPRGLEQQFIHEFKRRTSARAIASALGVEHDQVDVDIVDLNRFIQMVEAGRAPIDLAVPSADLVAIPSVRGLPDAGFIGHIPARALIQALTPDGAEFGQISQRVFMENVRAYLGPETPVNRAILETILSPERRRHFHLLNNGIVIIARACSDGADGATKIFHNVCIVNGCQTTSTLAAASSQAGPDVLDEVPVPVRFVVLDDADLISAAVVGLNTQAAINSVGLLSREPLVARIAREFIAFDRRTSGEPYYFARRQNEHALAADASRVIGLQHVIEAYWHAFSASPHAGLGPAGIAERVTKRGSLLKSDQDPRLYVAAGIMRIHVLRAPRRETNRRRAASAWGGANLGVFATRRLIERKHGLELVSSGNATRDEAAIEALLNVLADEEKIAAIATRAVDIVIEAFKARPSRGPANYADWSGTEAATQAVATRINKA